MLHFVPHIQWKFVRKSGAGSDVMINSRAHNSKKSLIELFVHVHANSSVWLHVPGSH